MQDMEQREWSALPALVRQQQLALHAAPSAALALLPRAYPARSTLTGVPATVLAPLGDTIRDFDGVRAVRVRLPRLG